MMEFEKQSEMMDMKEEMMSDAIDDALGDEDDEDERWLMFSCGNLPTKRLKKDLVSECVCVLDEEGSRVFPSRTLVVV